jgi:hypothetical protein
MNLKAASTHQSSMDWSLRRNTGLPLVQQRNAQLNFTVPPSILLRATEVIE